MYCNVCNKYRKFRKTYTSYIFKRTLSPSIAYSKCGHEYEKKLKRRINLNIKSTWFY